MAGALGTLVVEVAANVARFSSDMGKVAQIAEKNAAQVQKAFDFVGTSLKSIGAGFAVGLTLDKAKSQIEGVIKSAAGLQQLSERTGSTVEALSGLASVAKLSGTDTEALAGGLQKLSKALVDAQAGGATTSAAFKALNLSVTDLKGKSPAEVFEAIARAQANYADGADKVAVMQALLGKSGANLLPVMKDIVAVGELQAKVTGDQAARADEYEKTLTRLQAAQGAIWKRIAFELLPVMEAFAQSMLESAKGGNGLKSAVDSLAKDNTLRDWAQSVAMAIGTAVEAITGMVKAVQAVVGSFQAVFADLKVMGTFFKNGGVPGLAFQSNRDELKAALEERNATVEKANQRYVELWNSDKTAFTRGLQRRFDLGNLADSMTAGLGASGDSIRAARSKAPTLSFNPGSDEEKAKKKAGESFVESLQRQYEQQTKNRFEMLRLEAAQKEVTKAAEPWIKKLEDAAIFQKQLKDLEEQAARAEAARAKQGEYQSQAGSMVQAVRDQTSMLSLNAIQQRRVTELRKLDAMAIRAMGEATQETFPEVVKQFDTMRAKLIAALDELEAMERKLAGSSSEGARRAFEAYALNAADVAKSTENLITGSLQRLEDALVNFVKTGKLNFSDLFSFMAEEYLRQLIRMSIADFLPGGKGMGGGGLFAMGATWLKGVFGFANGISYVPRDNMPAILHEGERVLTKSENAGRSDGTVIQIGQGQVINVGSNVSRADVAAALKASQAQTVEHIRRLERQGRFA